MQIPGEVPDSSGSDLVKFLRVPVQIVGFHRVPVQVLGQVPENSGAGT